MSYVLDASAAIEVLLRTSTGLRALDIVSGADVAAPELLDAEVMSFLRRAVRSALLTAHRADEALEDLAAWPLERLGHRPLLARAWALRANVSAYDALYVAAAQARAAAVLTADGRLSRAPGLPAPILYLRAP